jgi:hypothetical protein
MCNPGREVKLKGFRMEIIYSRSENLEFSKQLSVCINVHLVYRFTKFPCPSYRKSWTFNHEKECSIYTSSLHAKQSRFSVKILITETKFRSVALLSLKKYLDTLICSSTSFSFSFVCRQFITEIQYLR